MESTAVLDAPALAVVTEFCVRSFLLICRDPGPISPHAGSNIKTGGTVKVPPALLPIVKFFDSTRIDL
jgi:hypothetical protein